MFNLIVLQTGVVRKVVGIEAVRHRNELDEILSSGFFWGIVIFCIVCVFIYAIVKDRDK